jgi:hypothetical protein
MLAYLIVCVSAVIVAGLTLLSGFGLGTLLLPAFLLFFPVEVAVAATAVVHLANNLFKVGLVGRSADWQIALAFGLPGAVLALAGAWLLTLMAGAEPLYRYALHGRGHEITVVKLVVGALMIAFGLLELLPSLEKLEFPRSWLPLGGALSGFFGGISGHQGALRAAFLSKTGLSAAAFIATSVICAVIVDVSRLTVYGLSFYAGHLHILRGGIVGLVIAGTIAAFIGSFVGSRLMKRMTMRGVQALVGVMLFGVAAALVAGLI